MAKSDFRVTSIFKTIIRICMKYVDFCGKTFKFLPKRCQFISCISRKLYFHRLLKRFKCTGHKHRKLNFCHKFNPFIQVWKCMD